jgi:Flp pilus assembly protein TadD
MVLAPIAAIFFALLQQPPASVSDFAVYDGNNAFELRDYVHAVTSFERAIQLDPKNVVAYRRLATVFDRLDRLADAIATCSKGIAANPADTLLLVDRGRYRIYNHQVDLAIADLSRAETMRAGTAVRPLNAKGEITRMQIDDGELWLHLGFARYLNGEFAAAVAPFDTCLRTPSRSQCEAWRFLALRRAGRAREAQAALDSLSIPIGAQARLGNFFFMNILWMFKRLGPNEDPVVQELPKNASPSILLAAARVRTSVAFNLGTWHVVNGHADRARSYFEQAIAPPVAPHAFEVLAAEAELERMKP